jgi:hypothetical protein
MNMMMLAAKLMISSKVISLQMSRNLQLNPKSIFQIDNVQEMSLTNKLLRSLPAVEIPRVISTR